MNGESPGISEEALLELRKITFSYKLRKGEKLQVFNDLSLKVRYAEFLGIAGEKDMILALKA